jgi:hypothetical protein
MGVGVAPTATALAFNVARGLLQCWPSTTDLLEGHVPIGPGRERLVKDGSDFPSLLIS